VRTREPCADVEGLEFDGFERRHLAGRLKNDELRRRSGSGSAAERAILEMSVRSGMLVMAMMGRHGKGAWHRRCRRTQFQQKRRPAGRHETDGHVCPQQQHRQQNAGQYVVSPTVECRWFHDCEPTMPDRIPPHQWGKYEVRPEHAAGSVALHLRVATNTGRRRRPLGAAGAAHRRERLGEIPPRHHVFDVGGQFTPPVWILPIGARNVDRIDHPQKILDLQ
jgi:hypothetical protein